MKDPETKISIKQRRRAEVDAHDGRLIPGCIHPSCQPVRQTTSWKQTTAVNKWEGNLNVQRAREHADVQDRSGWRTQGREKGRCPPLSFRELPSEAVHMPLAGTHGWLWAALVIMAKKKTTGNSVHAHHVEWMSKMQVYSYEGLPWWLSGRESACNAEDPGSIPGWGRSTGGQHGNPL